MKDYEKGTDNVKVTAADFSDIMKKTVENIEKAREFAADDNQSEMLKNYIEHFKYGDIEMHKESQRNWIKDVGPIVESCIGFIETY